MKHPLVSLTQKQIENIKILNGNSKIKFEKFYV